MANTLNVTLDMRLKWDFQRDDGLSIPQDYQVLKERQELASGTGDEQASSMYRVRLNMEASVASPPDTHYLDISGDLTDVFGETVNFKRIRQIVVINKGVPNANHTEWTITPGENVLVGGYGGGASAGGWAELFNLDVDAQILLRSGGMFVCTAPVDGWRVVEGTEDVLQLEFDGSGTNDIDVDVILIGVS